MNVIEQGQIKAKFSNDQERRLIADIYIDYYRNVTRDTLKALITDMFEDSSDAVELCKYIESDGVVEDMINKTALVFGEGVEIELPDASEKQNEEFQAQLDEMQFNIVMDNVDKYVRLLRDCPVGVFVTGGKVQIRPITPEKCFVEQSPEDPTQFDRFYYQVGILENTAGRNAVDIYDCWEKKDGKVAKFRCQIDTNGHPIPESIEYYDDIPKYTDIPIVIFRDYMPDDSVWYRGASHLINKAIAIDKKRTDLAMAEAYNIPQLLTTGMDAESKKNWKRGRSYHLNIPPNNLGEAAGDAKFISPSEALEELNKIIQDRYERLGLQNDLSKSQITGETATSGYQLALSKQDVRDLTKRRRKYYNTYLRSLCARIIEALAVSVRIVSSTENLSVNIKYKEPVILESTEERERGWALRFANKTANLVDYELAMNSAISTREQALEIIKARMQEIAEISKITNPYIEPEEEPEEEDV